MRRFVLTLLAAAGCELTTGLNDLTFEPEPCIPNDPELVCQGVACGSVVDNCEQTVACPDRCVAPFACAVGGVGANECGCTGGVAHLTPQPPEGCTLATTPTRAYYFCGMASFEAARAFCRGFGTDLAVVLTAAENEFLRGMMPQNSWLGLRDEDGCLGLSCEWVWVDGTPLDWFNWNTGEPNNTGNGEFCAEIQKEFGGWNDVPCANALATMCETTCPDP